MKKLLFTSIAVLVLSVGFFVGWVNDVPKVEPQPVPVDVIGDVSVVEMIASDYAETETTLTDAVVDKTDPKMGHVGSPIPLGASPVPVSFVRVENGVVVDSIIADQAFIDSGRKGDPKEWIPNQYSDGSVKKNYAGIGYTYDKDRDAFIPPKGVEATVFNTKKARWEAPVTRTATSTPETL